MIYKKAYIDSDNKVVRFIQKHYNYDFKISNYLYNQGYDTIEKVKGLLNIDNSSFFDPFGLTNMKEAIDLIKLHIEKSNKIVICGDYDMDGIGATAILYKGLFMSGANVECFIPNKKKDGYGLSQSALNKITKRFNPKLIITVDCGISNCNEIELCRQLGVDVIVTDHHEIPSILPKCIIVDPKLKDCKYRNKNLCGAGVALKIVQALVGQVSDEMLSICAISTIADMVELTGENRYIVKNGLLDFFHKCPIGLKPLLEKINITTNVNTKDIAYKLAPKLNSAGRLSDATLSLKLLIENRMNLIVGYTDEIIELNKSRSTITNQIFEEALLEIKNSDLDKHSIIIVYKKEWETGVIGIVASKLMNLFNKPIIVCGYEANSGNIVASARSLNEVNVFDIIDKVKDLLVTFGGHKYASGFSIKPENYPLFLSQIYLLEKSIVYEESNDKKYDILLTIDEINLNLITQLESLEPFGLGFPKPRFATISDKIEASFMKNYRNYLVGKIGNIPFISFNNPKAIYELNGNKNIVLFEPYIDTFFGRSTLKLDIVDSELLEISNDKSLFLNGNYFAQLFFDSDERLDNARVYNKLSEIELKNKRFIIIDSFVSNEYSRDDCSLCLGYLNAKTRNIFYCSPIDYELHSLFDIIIFIDKPLSNGLLSYISEHNPNSIIYIPNKLPFNVTSFVSSSRAVFGRIYLSVHDEAYFDFWDCYTKCMKNTTITFVEFLYAIKTFEELKLLEIKKKSGDVRIKKLSGKTNLEDSEIYNKIRNGNYGNQN